MLKSQISIQGLISNMIFRLNLIFEAPFFKLSALIKWVTLKHLLKTPSVMFFVVNECSWCLQQNSCDDLSSQNLNVDALQYVFLYVHMYYVHNISPLVLLINIKY